MTAAAQKQVTEKVLAWPRRARAKLAQKLVKSLESHTEKISKKEWNLAWTKEINKRVEEIESGKVKCIPYEEARKGWNKILGRS